MKYYLFLMGALYIVGAFFHLLDIFDLRLQFSQMNTTWKIWTLFLLIVDSTAAQGLLLRKKYGEHLFIFIATTQLIAYLGFKGAFGNQNFLIIFHIITLCLYVVIKIFQKIKK